MEYTEADLGSCGVSLGSMTFRYLAILVLVFAGLPRPNVAALARLPDRDVTTACCAHAATAPACCEKAANEQNGPCHRTGEVCRCGMRPAGDPDPVQPAVPADDGKVITLGLASSAPSDTLEPADLAGFALPPCGPSFIASHSHNEFRALLGVWHT